MFCKMANFELQTRVPMMIRAPWLPMGGRSTTAYATHAHHHTLISERATHLSACQLTLCVLCMRVVGAASDTDTDTDTDTDADADTAALRCVICMCMQNDRAGRHVPNGTRSDRPRRSTQPFP
jgi:hypothetical protein